MQHDLEHRIPLAPQKKFSKLKSACGYSLCYLAWHKMIDLFFVLCGMIVLILVLPLIALLIYVDSPGPIFYAQERLGFRGKKFYIIKFRSMVVDAEAAGRAIWASEYDSRVTRIGRVMRRLHLDELPQVINILRGEMSLIGPRPEREAFVIELEKTIPQYRARLTVKPGLTGWAQVKYRYTRTEQEALAKLRYDLYYIEHRSIKLDIVIILKTVLEVLLCHGT
ncbi:MAG TPA: sugar transferase [Ktedonosporobacter sp.]|nr:sugar transferase [Ktedonosporobacter sp.]